MKSRILAFVSLALASALAHANLIVNGSFEDGNFVPNGDNTMSLSVGATDMTGWTVVDDVIAWIADPNPFNGIFATDGKKSLDLTGYPGTFGGVAQTFSTQVGATYVVDYDLGANSEYGDAALSVDVGQGQNGISLHSDSGQLWEHHTYQFTALDSTTTLKFLHNFDGGQYTGLDNAVVTLKSVPEPTAMALLALAPLALRRRRK